MPQLTDEQRKQWEEKIKNMSPEELQELQRQQCIFCQIVTGKITSKKVYEDAVCLAILDINPAAKGHLLLLPKDHYAIMPQIPEKVLSHLTIVSKNLSQVLLKVLRADGTTVFIANGTAAGQRAQHFLMHLLPRKNDEGLLPAEERLIGADMTLKVKAAIEQKLLTLLGGKKDGNKEARTEAKENSAADNSDEKKTPLINSVSEKLPKNNSEEPSDEPAARKKESPKTAPKPKTARKSAKKTAQEPAQNSSSKTNKPTSNKLADKQIDKQDRASLDDIARLFK